jgi:hypothetical protein
MWHYRNLYEIQGRAAAENRGTSRTDCGISYSSGMQSYEVEAGDKGNCQLSIPKPLYAWG